MKSDQSEYQISSWWEEFSSPNLGSYDLCEVESADSRVQTSSVYHSQTQAITDQIIQFLLVKSISDREKELLQAILMAPLGFEDDFLREKIEELVNFIESLFPNGDLLAEVTENQTLSLVLFWENQIIPIDEQKILSSLNI